MEPLVVYIIGDSRSGSTLLDYLISCHPDAISLGEMHHLSDYYKKSGYGFRSNWECSCGRQVQDCNFWRQILEPVDVANSFETRLPYSSPFWTIFSKTIHKWSLRSVLDSESMNYRAKIFSDNCWSIYERVHEIQNKSLIIDSSKKGIEAYFLKKFNKGNIKFILLERDIRAVAYSKLKRAIGHEPDPSELRNSIYYFKYLISSFRVYFQNRVFKRFFWEDFNENILSIDYQQLTERTDELMKEIWSYLDLDNFSTPTFTNQIDKELHVLHGSPSRYDRQQIRPDNKWMKYLKSKVIMDFFANRLKIKAEKYNEFN